MTKPPWLSALVCAAIMAPSAGLAQDQPPAPATTMAELTFPADFMASRAHDPRLYVLLGSGFLRPFTVDKDDHVAQHWRQAHPAAVVTPISRMISTNTRTHVPMEMVYVWIEDGADSLNVALVRAGTFRGGTMADMVDNQRGLDQMLQNDPSMADAWAQIRKERAASPLDRTERLISDSDYHARMVRIDEAERYARANKLGIWSDAMKEEREAEGIQ